MGLSIAFSCRSCGRHLQALEEPDGRVVGCPRCGWSLLVPAGEPLLLEVAEPRWAALGRVHFYLGVALGIIVGSRRARRRPSRQSRPDAPIGAPAGPALDRLASGWER